jgi:lysophospholipid acyltransferase (LPLAT)-like uncharacterized protein
MSPRRYAIAYAFGWFSKVISTLLFSTCRIKVFGQEIESKYLEENQGRGLLYASWHRGLFFFIYLYRNLKFVVMASASKDGELAAQATKRHGWVVVRGSSSYRGSQALREMLPLFKKGHRGGLVVDAPQGPPYISKIGIVALARRTRLPIIPVMWSADRCWRLKSWDRTIIPKPFSRIVVLYADDFITVPADATKEECEGFRQKLDATLNRMMYQTDSFLKSNQFGDPRQIKVPEPLLQPDNL